MRTNSSEHEQSEDRTSQRKRWTTPLVILSEVQDTEHTGVHLPVDSAPNVTFSLTS